MDPRACRYRRPWARARSRTRSCRLCRGAPRDRRTRTSRDAAPFDSDEASGRTSRGFDATRGTRRADETRPARGVTRAAERSLRLARGVVRGVAGAADWRENGPGWGVAVTGWCPTIPCLSTVQQTLKPSIDVYNRPKLGKLERETPTISRQLKTVSQAPPLRRHHGGRAPQRRRTQPRAPSRATPTPRRLRVQRRKRRPVIILRSHPSAHRERGGREGMGR